MFDPHRRRVPIDCGFLTLVAIARCTVSSPAARLAETCWGLKTVADASGTAAGVTPF